MRAKQAIIGVCARLGCFPIGLALQRLAFGPHHLRVLNYHATPASAADNFERQLAFLSRSYAPAGPSDLEACLASRGRLDRPGLVLTFDDGYRSNYDVAAPLIERHGFRGYFFVPEGVVAESRAEADADFAKAAPNEPEPRVSWQECRDLAARGHRIGCHSRTHVRLSDDLPVERLADEITKAGRDMAERLKGPVTDFCWVGGEEWSYGRGAYDEIRRAGYARAFMTNLYPVTARTSPLWLQRTNVESDWPLDQLRFYLSGLMDLAYAPKRRRIARKLARRT
jgi:peptidoglycan/xylan/chitin deacetylase (PgdA/CDA1 family)